MNYVIIGNSAAAVGCIEGIRQKDKTGTITVISNEPYHTYGRPLISYLLWGKTTLKKMDYRPKTFYQDNQVKPMLGRTAEKIDVTGKQVYLDGGEIVTYDKLLIATGSRPFIPPMEGYDKVENKFTFLSLDDAKALEKALFPGARVLIIGAGLIGLKCAEGISEKCGKITVVDLADRILPSVLDQKGSQIVEKHIQKQGIDFILSNSVQKFEKQEAILKDGQKLEFDILVTAVGVRPNTELVKDAGGEINRGIVTDENGKTSLPDVYAAGDCTESYDITIQQRRILALLPNAYRQGETAGISMAGGNKPLTDCIPMNAVGFFGLHIITAGSYEGDEFVTCKGGNYKKLVSKDGVLKGYILIGDVARAGIYTAMIRNETPLSTVDFDLLKKKPQLMAFSSSVRAEELGGVPS